jgi:hypothetical protein
MGNRRRGPSSLITQIAARWWSRRPTSTLSRIEQQQFGRLLICVISVATREHAVNFLVAQLPYIHALFKFGGIMRPHIAID